MLYHSTRELHDLLHALEVRIVLLIIRIGSGGIGPSWHFIMGPWPGSVNSARRCHCEMPHCDLSIRYPCEDMTDLLLSVHLISAKGLLQAYQSYLKTEYRYISYQPHSRKSAWPGLQRTTRTKLHGTHHQHVPAQSVTAHQSACPENRCCQSPETKLVIVSNIEIICSSSGLLGGNLHSKHR